MSRRISIVLTSILAAACGSARQSSDPKSGQIKLSATTTTHLSTGDYPDGVCGTFTLQPYSLDTNGNETVAGASVTLTSVATSQTDAILGCIDGATDSSGDNWGYFVTATDFFDCTTNQPIAGLSPSTLTANYPIDCQAGVDTPLVITADVSIAQANSGGYIDISAGVSSTDVQIGCKDADIDTSGDLHFGEQGFYTGGTGPLAFIGIGLSDSSTGANVPLTGNPAQQFDGLITNGTQQSAYYTGLLPLVPQTSTWDVLQTFAQQCASGQYYAATEAPVCNTLVQNSTTQGTTGPVASTTASLADVLVVVPGQLWAAATVGSAYTLSIISGTGSALSDANPSASVAWNPLTLSQTLTFSDPVEGLYVDQLIPGEMLVLLGTAGGPSYAEIAFDPVSGQWLANPPTPISDLTASQAAQLGLFQQVQAGCQTVNTGSYQITVDLSGIQDILAAALDVDSSSVTFDLHTSLRQQVAGGGWSEQATSDQSGVGAQAVISSSTRYGLYSLQAELDNVYVNGVATTMMPINGYPIVLAPSVFSLQGQSSLMLPQQTASALFVDSTMTNLYGFGASTVSLTAPSCTDSLPAPFSDGSSGFIFGLTGVSSVSGVREYSGEDDDFLQLDEIFLSEDRYSGTLVREEDVSSGTRVDLGSTANNSLQAAFRTSAADSATCNDADTSSAAFVQPLAELNQLQSSTAPMWLWATNDATDGFELYSVTNPGALNEAALRVGSDVAYANIVSGMSTKVTLASLLTTAGTALPEGAIIEGAAFDSGASVPTLRFGYSWTVGSGFAPMQGAGSATFDAASGTWTAQLGQPYDQFLGSLVGTVSRPVGSGSGPVDGLFWHCSTNSLSDGASCLCHNWFTGNYENGVMSGGGCMTAIISQ